MVQQHDIESDTSIVAIINATSIIMIVIVLIYNIIKISHF